MNYYKKARELYHTMEISDKIIVEEKDFKKLRAALQNYCHRKRNEKIFKTKLKTLTIWRRN